MKYLITLIVCALLTVGLIFAVELTQLVLPDPTPWTDENWPSTTAVGIGFGLILLIGMGLPIVILFATIWAVIGFTKTVNRWIAENQGNDCPPVMHSRHSKDAHDLLDKHLKDNDLK